jgi:hypothetical protein
MIFFYVDKSNNFCGQPVLLSNKNGGKLWEKYREKNWNLYLNEATLNHQVRDKKSENKISGCCLKG